MIELARRLILQTIGLAALASLTLAAVPSPPSAGVHTSGSAQHSQHVNVTATVQVTRSCHASFSESRGKLHIDGDCESGDRDSEHFSSDDRDNRRIYRIDDDAADGLTVVQF